MPAKIVLSKEEAERIAVSYAPRKFPATMQSTAHEFMSFNAAKAEGQESGFRIDRLVAEQTGIAELERLSIEEKVEREALLRVKELQEQAYQQAYQLGLDEGREKAFVERQSDLNESLLRMTELLASIERLKADLIAFNEAQIIQLIFGMARRLIMHEISVKPDLILEAVRQAVASAQSDEHVTVRVSPKDFAFIEGTREKLGKDFESVKRAKIEASDEVADGGCVVETNYGVVNATIDQRLEKLWRAVAEKLPKIQDVIATSPGDGTSDGNQGA